MPRAVAITRTRESGSISWKVSRSPVTITTGIGGSAVRARSAIVAITSSASYPSTFTFV